MPAPKINRYANGHRRRQLRKQVLAEEDTCHICHRDVDKDLHHLDPWSATLDELIPVSKGGSPLERENVRLAHRTYLQHQTRRRHTTATCPDVSDVAAMDRLTCGYGRVPLGKTSAHHWHYAVLMRPDFAKGGVFGRGPS